jgi:hypothetical protein
LGASHSGLNGIQEVSGSIPLISTNENLQSIGIAGFLLVCGQTKILRNGGKLGVVRENY